MFRPFASRAYRFGRAGLAIIGLGTVLNSVVPKWIEARERRSLNKGSDGIILHIDLTRPLTESDNGMPNFFGKGCMKVWDVIEGLELARTDKRVKAVVAHIGPNTNQLAIYQEIFDAVQSFRKDRPQVPTIAYASSFLTSGSNADFLTYYLASAFGHVYMQPTGHVMMGLSASPMLFKETLEKMGVEMEVMKREEYKTAMEPLSRTEMSSEFREQVNTVLDTVYNHLVSDISASRNQTVEDLKKAVDQCPVSAAEAEKLGLVDGLRYKDEIAFALYSKFANSKAKAAVEDDDEIFTVAQLHGRADVKTAAKVHKWLASHKMTIQAYVSARRNELKSKALGRGSSSDAVALVVLDGPIAEGGNGMDGRRQTHRIRTALTRAEKDREVKAIVLRINSPGGSAVASDSLGRLVERCAKPVVVSMGSVAASGGYWVALYGDRILASRATITGSIGVVAGRPVFEGLLAKLGVHGENFRRGENADWVDFSRPLSESARERLENVIDSAYVDFKSRVTEKRSEQLKEKGTDVANVAGGRIFFGETAAQLGLVDQVGGFRESIAEAKKLGGIPETTYAPVKDMSTGTFFQELMEAKEMKRGAAAAYMWSLVWNSVVHSVSGAVREYVSGGSPAPDAVSAVAAVLDD